VQSEHDRSALLAAMSNADCLHREQLQQMGSSLREALTSERQRIQSVEQQWLTEKAELTAQLQAAQEYASSCQAYTNDAFVLLTELKSTVQGLKQCLSTVQGSFVERDADAVQMLDSVLQLRNEADVITADVKRCYEERVKSFSTVSSNVCTALQEIEEQLLRAITNDDQESAAEQ
jgi:hypothetical protein